MKYQITPILEGYEIKNCDERFIVTPENGQPFEVRSWWYKIIYQNPGLYEALYLDFYNNKTHIKSIEHFNRTRAEFEDVSKLRVLDYAAGVGLVGEELFKYGEIDSMVAMDRLHEALIGAKLRANLYKNYLIGDLAEPESKTWDYLKAQRFNTIFALSAVGTGDADKNCMQHLCQLLVSGGWLVFNVRAETTEDQEEIIEVVGEYGQIVHDS